MQSLSHRTIALIEDDPLMGESLVHSLSLEGATVNWWTSGEEALGALGEESSHDVLVCDLRLPGMSGEELFHSLSRLRSDLPVLFMTAYGEIDQAVELMRAGAGDYVTKPFELPEFLSRLTALMPPVEEAPAVLGVSPLMRSAEAFLQRIAEQSGPLLITGETGVGKEVAARHLHALACPDAPFMAVNCAAIPADLLESELFGHERGAFTSAERQHLGYAERAKGGILFLDEISELPTPLQAKLLRLIEERRFFRLGGEKPVTFRARVVAASNKEIAEEIKQGRFRQDLFYRLETFTLELPPLRSRPEDTAWLLERFAASYAPNSDGRIRGVSALAAEAARGHSWPGNVRELRNRVERAAALATGPLLMPADLFPSDPMTLTTEQSRPLADIRDAAERRAIEGALSDSGGQLQKAAQLLGISRTTLWEKMKRLGLSS